MTYDFPSLLAGKFHAVLSRKYTKGRDFFDLGWYFSRWKGLAPNLILLHHALEQTGWEGVFPDENNWRPLIADVVRRAHWVQETQDVESFLERPSDMAVFNQDSLLRLTLG